MLTPKNHCVISAFMMEGLHDAGYSAVLAAWDQGCFELVSTMVEYAPFAERLVDASLPITGGEFPGVFDYEVTAPFGKWFGGTVLSTKTAPPADDCREWLRQAVFDFFAQADLKIEKKQELGSALAAVPNESPIPW